MDVYLVEMRSRQRRFMQRQRKDDMSVQALEDERILDILRKDSQRGLVLLMEKYTGLIWHVVSFYVENPEDIKECINDTFTNFYFQRKRFDPGKASLSVYLTAIARKLAISRYRKERIRQAEPLAEDMVQEDRGLSDMELRLDMERAMSLLKPNELQIIRMKYYDGMTVREIAESLKLPYETVKKRHQRSIVKLGQGLLLLLILLLSFSVCVYGVLRYFDVIPSVWTGGNQVEPEVEPQDKAKEPEALDISDEGRNRPGRTEEYDEEAVTEEIRIEIPDSPLIKARPKTSDGGLSLPATRLENYTVSPGYGINMNPGESVYSLTEKVVYEGEGYTLTLEEVVYINHTVTVTAVCRRHIMAAAGEGETGGMDRAGGFRLEYDGSVWGSQGSITRDLDAHTQLWTICFEDVAFPSLEQGLKGVKLAADGGTCLSFDMKPVEQESLGMHPYQIGERGGVLAVPRMEEGELIVAIYPLDYEDGNKMIPALIRDTYGSWAGEYVTAVREDGTVLKGECMWYSPRNARTYYEWNFGAASPGNYTLNIPVIYQESLLNQEFDIPLDLKESTWEGQDYPVPGGSVYIKECTPSEDDIQSGKGRAFGPAEEEPDGNHPSGDGRALGRTDDSGGDILPDMGSTCGLVRPERKRWRLRIGYTSEDPAYSVAGFYGAYCEVGEGMENQEHICDRQCIRMTLNTIDVENQVVEYTLEADADMIGLEDAYIRFHKDDIINYRWNQEFEIPFSV